MFPFGFGLSYTSFAYTGVEVTPAGDGFDVEFTVKNTGKVKGAETAQVYVDSQLKGYDKVMLEPGKSAKLKIHLDSDAFKHYDMSVHDWVTDRGEHTVVVSGNSAETLLQATVEVK